MQILFLTNLYPPLGNGGYEQWCQEAAEGLRRQGCPVTVLTSRTGLERLPRPDPQWVFRELHFEMDFNTRTHSLDFFTRRKAQEAKSLAILERTLDRAAPDVAVIWGMWNLPRSLAARLETELPGRVVYYLGDYWPALPSQHRLFWDAPSRNWLTHLPKQVLRPLAEAEMSREPLPKLELAHVLIPSRFMLAELSRRGVQYGQARVVPGGVDTSLYVRPLGPEITAGQGLRLLVAGRLSPEKGIETALAAMAELERRGAQGFSLSVVGSGEQGYVSHLRSEVQALGLEQVVAFSPPVSKAEMPRLYHAHDVLLFPSLWEEPFGRTLVEAMASGLVVAGTATGGAAEILEAGVNGLIFPAGDAPALAEVLLRLQAQPELRARLSAAGQRTALERFDVRQMVTGIRQALLDLLEGERV